jgi:alginate O-acetyltransferase complex protein AlgI
MLFPTLAFALFFVVVFIVNWIVRPRPVVWRVAMFAASLFFYGYWNWRFVLLLLGSIVGNWFMAEQVQRAGDSNQGDLVRAWVRTAVVANLTLLGVYKYYDFFAVELSNLLGRVGIDDTIGTLDLTLPVGISFFTFQAMSYVVDVGRGHIRTMAPLDFAVYLSFFPQLVAGPIVRASEMAPQMAQRPDPRQVESAEAFRLIFAGLFKKVVVSSYLADQIVDDVFADPGAHTGWEVLIGTYGYAIQIYADFSGYTDIAIGVALLLGFRFPQNFNAPYSALSIGDFWRRWHMTLSNWLRDYLYIPLGGNRGGELLTYRNLALTMLLGGLWHGSSWNFVIWGGIHGGALAVERFVSNVARRRGFKLDLPPELIPILQWLATFHVVCLAWVFFRAESFGAALDVLGQLGSLDGASELVTPLLIITIALAIGSQFVPTSAVRKVEERFVDLGWAVQGVALGLSLVVIDVFGPEGVAPFIYFQF